MIYDILPETRGMKIPGISITTTLLLVACTTQSGYDPLEDYEELDATTIIDAPSPPPDAVAPENRAAVARGEYLVELLGCGACHTDGALIGRPQMERSLAGSETGIAYTNPLQFRHPGVVYPPNITPDDETGIGSWTDRQIADAIRAGLGRHMPRRNLVMPWQGYAKLTDDDVYAIVGYLRSIDPVYHRVPENVPPGRPATHPFVHFGVYRSR